jgi:hypothetical protein
MKNSLTVLSFASILLASGFAHATIGNKISCHEVLAKDDSAFIIDVAAQSVSVFSEGKDQGSFPAKISNDGTHMVVDTAFRLILDEKDGQITGVMHFWNESNMVCTNL